MQSGAEWDLLARPEDKLSNIDHGYCITQRSQETTGVDFKEGSWIINHRLHPGFQSITIGRYDSISLDVATLSFEGAHETSIHKRLFKVQASRAGRRIT